MNIDALTYLSALTTDEEKMRMDGIFLGIDSILRKGYDFRYKQYYTVRHFKYHVHLIIKDT